MPNPSLLPHSTTRDFDNTDKTYLKTQNDQYFQTNFGNSHTTTNEIHISNQVVSYSTKSLNRVTSFRSCAKGDRPSRKVHFINPSSCSTTKFNGMRRNWTFLNLSNSGLASMATEKDLNDQNISSSQSSLIYNNNNDDIKSLLHLSASHHNSSDNDALNSSSRDLDIPNDLDENDWECAATEHKRLRASLNIQHELTEQNGTTSKNKISLKQYPNLALNPTLSSHHSNLCDFRTDHNPRKRLSHHRRDLSLNNQVVPVRPNFCSSSSSSVSTPSSFKSQLHRFVVSTCPVVEVDSSLSSSFSFRSKESIDLNPAEFSLKLALRELQGYSDPQVRVVTDD